MSLIVYELNEVPKKLFNFYANIFPNSALSKLKLNSYLFETNTADIGHLSPWVTWPTMHRGVSNIQHEISDLGQDLTKVNKEFPSIYDHLAKNGINVGVFGSLQSYPLPKNLDNFSFYVPDTFAAGKECFPKYLSDFQEFNLSMVKSNGRNVSKGIAVKEAGKFLLNASKMGLQIPTVFKLSNQIIKEHINKDRVVRRRTSQAEISFDLYYDQLIKTRPDISFFFTNHVASSMHRYWPTIFPEDYDTNKFDIEWLERWKLEIPHAVKVSNYQIDKLLKYCDSTNSELVVCSSMGQGAVKDIRKINKQVLITNIKKLLRFLNIPDEDWEPRLSMAPRIVVKPRTDKFYESLKLLDKININGKKIKYLKTSTDEIRFDIGLDNIDKLVIEYNGQIISSKNIGIENINLQDASGSYAYHIPQGILLHYKPTQIQKLDNGHENWAQISALDFCPSIISKFDGTIPSYMKGDSKLFS